VDLTQAPCLNSAASSLDNPNAMSTLYVRSPPGTSSLQPTTDRKVRTQRLQQLVEGTHVAETTRKALQDNETVTPGLADLPGILGSCRQGAGGDRCPERPLPEAYTTA